MIVTLTGPTAAGKSTVERLLQAMGYGRAISHTTRAPRAGERDGDAYHFVSPMQFETLDALGAFIEKIDLGPRKYGMSKDEIHRCNAACPNTAIVVDPHGAAQIREYCRSQGIAVYSVWIDCGVDAQSKRWVSRVAADLMNGVEAVGPAAERLAIMMTDEVKWREDAARGTIYGAEEYDIFLNSSMKSPEDLAVTIRRRVARAFMGEPAAVQHVRV